MSVLVVDVFEIDFKGVSAQTCNLYLKGCEYGCNNQCRA